MEISVRYAPRRFGIRRQQRQSKLLCIGKGRAFQVVVFRAAGRSVSV